MTETIPFAGLIKGRGDGWDGFPDNQMPYYAGFVDGLFVHKRMLIGRGVSKVSHWPTSFPKVGATGLFDFEAPPIPAKLIGQVVNFFERIYDRQHTEAAVLLVMHEETKEWRIFVPTQLVSHGGVNYVHEPLHIKRPWVTVGSIHSHCDFGAGHSSTDTGDAEDFDGLHMTTGHIKQDIPQIVAMVSMNKQNVHFKPEDFPKLFDYSEVKQHEAPAWWDRYVEDPKKGIKPVGFELYEKYQKSTVVKSEKTTNVTQPTKPSPGYQSTHYNADDWYFNKEANRMVRKDWKVDKDGTITYPNGHKVAKGGYYQPTQPVGKGQHGLTIIRKGETQITKMGETQRRHNFIEGVGYGSAPRQTQGNDWDDFYRLMGMEESPSEWSTISPTDLLEAGYSWDPGDKTWHWTGDGQAKSLEDIASTILNESTEFNARQMAERGVQWDEYDGALLRPPTMTELERLGIVKDEPFWEDMLPENIVTTVTASNLVTEDDLDYILYQPHHAGTIEFWQHLIMQKAIAACETLQALGIDASVKVKAAPPPDAILLPESNPIIHATDIGGL